MNDRASWLAARKLGIGGSDIAAVLGMHPYMSQVQLWANKTGRAPDKESALRLRFGQFGEDFVAKEYELATGCRTVRHNAMLRHPDYPMAIGNVDRLIVPDGRKVAAIRGGIVADKLLEAKTVSSYAKREEWGPAGTDEVPAHYCLQTHWYLALTPCTDADLAAMFGAGEELAIYTIRKDADLETELLRRAAEWWRQHVENDVAPDPQSEADVRLLYPKDNQREIEASQEAAECVSALHDLKGMRSEIEEREQDVRDRLLAFIGEASVLRHQGATLATYKAARDGSKTDWKAVAQAMNPPAELIAQHTIQTAGSRRLLLK